MGLLPASAVPALPVRPAPVGAGQRRRHGVHVLGGAPADRAALRRRGAAAAGDGGARRRACGSRPRWSRSPPTRSPSACACNRCSTTATTGSRSCASVPPTDPERATDQWDSSKTRAGLDGKVALIAGGGGGLGKAIALDFARAGMHLILCDKNVELLEATAATIAETAEAPLTAHIDVRDADAFTKAFTEGLDRFGRLDMLVNVAGGTFKADFVETNSRGWDAVDPRQLRMAAAEHAAGGEADDRAGRWRQHHQPHVDRSAPCCTRVRGVRRDEGRGRCSFSRTMALEFAPHGIRVNNIAPDQTPTEGMPMSYDSRVDPGRDPDGPPGHRTRTSAGARSSWRPTCRRTSPGRTCTRTAARSRRRAGSTGRASGYVNNPPLSAFGPE